MKCPYCKKEIEVKDNRVVPHESAVIEHYGWQGQTRLLSQVCLASGEKVLVVKDTKHLMEQIDLDLY